MEAMTDSNNAEVSGVDYTCTVITRTHAYKIDGKRGTVRITDFAAGTSRQLADKVAEIERFVACINDLAHGDASNITKDPTMGADAAGDAGSAD